MSSMLDSDGSSDDSKEDIINFKGRWSSPRISDSDGSDDSKDDVINFKGRSSSLQMLDSDGSDDSKDYVINFKARSSSLEENLQKVLRRYIRNTFIYINRVKGFCKTISTWTDARKTELEKINQPNKINQPDLAAVLRDTLRGLEELNCFLDAVEKLAVTSLHVFMQKGLLPKEICLEQVQHLIVATRLICPLLLKFKRDASVFFSPSLQNVEVLAYHLDQYIQTTQIICIKLEKWCDIDFRLKKIKQSSLLINVDLTEDDIQRMLCHIEQLDEPRMDSNFRMVFLFQEVSCSGFISEFSERQPGMLQSLKELEEIAVQLDSMNEGAKITKVVGSTVGVAGGVLSIVGLALIPFTAGASAGLVTWGAVCGVSSGLGSAARTLINRNGSKKQQKKASEVFKSFMEDVQMLQDGLVEVMKRETNEIDVPLGVAPLLFSTAKMFINDDLILSFGKVVVQKGKALRHVKTAFVLSKSVMASLIGVNALFLGMDIYFLREDRISLAKGSETEASQFIRARAALWSSEMDAWQKIHDSLSKGLKTAGKNKAVLDTAFYSDK